MIFIHYGHKEFSPEKFGEIENIRYFCKPKGGLWASAIDAKYSWKEWCKQNEFMSIVEDNSFKFKLKNNARIYTINSTPDCIDLPKTPHIDGEIIKIDINSSHNPMIHPDFEELVKQGWDAILFNMSNDTRLYWLLYGWDCDSLLVLNKNVVEVI